MDSQAAFQITIIDLLHGSYDVFNEIISCLNIQDIIRLTQTCKQLRECVQMLYATKWNINAWLNHYLKNPQAFRSLQAKHDALIYGGAAVQFFARRIWPGRSLSLMMPTMAAVGEFKEHLISVEDYTEYQVVKRDNTYWKGLGFRLHRKTSGKASDTVICIWTYDCAPVRSLMGARHTAAFTFISWNKAFSAFPYSTFVEYKTYALSDLDDRTGLDLSRYVGRGWELAYVPFPWENAVERGLLGVRRIGDRKSWTMKLDTLGVQPSHTPDFVLDISEFENAITHQFNSHGEVKLQHIRSSFIPFKSAILKHEYTCAPHQSFYTTYAKWRLAALILMHCYTIPAEKRPNVEDLTIASIPDDFQIPDGLPYKDEDMVRWLEDWDRLDESRKW